MVSKIWGCWGQFKQNFHQGEKHWKGALVTNTHGLKFVYSVGDTKKLMDWMNTSIIVTLNWIFLYGAKTLCDSFIDVYAMVLIVEL